LGGFRHGVLYPKSTDTTSASRPWWREIVAEFVERYNRSASAAGFAEKDASASVGFSSQQVQANRQAAASSVEPSARGSALANVS